MTTETKTPKAADLLTIKGKVAIDDGAPKVEFSWTFDFTGVTRGQIIALALAGASLRVQAQGKWRALMKKDKVKGKAALTRTWNVKTEFIDKQRAPAKPKDEKVKALAEGASPDEIAAMLAAAR